MRAITDIAIQKKSSRVTMFLTYNGDSMDYGFENHETVESALESVKNSDQSYFPIKTDSYKFLDFTGDYPIEKIVKL